MLFHSKNDWYKAFVLWLPLGLVTLFLCGLVNLAVQQNYRMSANDPQIQAAEDVASAVSQGKATPDELFQGTPTEMASSLASFIITYTATGTPIVSSVVVDGKIPSLPSGIADYFNTHNEDRITWEPKPGLRIAAVITKFSGSQPGFALIGRSLREVEIREQNLNYITMFALLGAWILSYLLILILIKLVTKPALEPVPQEAKAEKQPEQTPATGHSHHHEKI